MAGARAPRDAAAGTIVVVDDDEARLGTVATLLRRAGFEVRPLGRAADVLAALEVDAAGIDCVFSDLHMPEMGGLELLDRLRRGWPDLPVVMMTADSAVAAAVEAMRL